jgi:hypothetical protein
MGIRGSKSVEAMVTPTVADLRGDARPEPPEDLTRSKLPSGVPLWTACRRWTPGRSATTTAS